VQEETKVTSLKQFIIQRVIGRLCQYAAEGSGFDSCQKHLPDGSKDKYVVQKCFAYVEATSQDTDYMQKLHKNKLNVERKVNDMTGVAKDKEFIKSSVSQVVDYSVVSKSSSLNTTKVAYSPTAELEDRLLYLFDTLLVVVKPLNFEIESLNTVLGGVQLNVNVIEHIILPPLEATSKSDNEMTVTWNLEVPDPPSMRIVFGGRRAKINKGNFLNGLTTDVFVKAPVEEVVELNRAISDSPGTRPTSTQVEVPAGSDEFGALVTHMEACAKKWMATQSVDMSATMQSRIAADPSLLFQDGLGDYTIPSQLFDMLDTQGSGRVTKARLEHLAEATDFFINGKPFGMSAPLLTMGDIDMYWSHDRPSKMAHGPPTDAGADEAITFRQFEQLVHSHQALLLHPFEAAERGGRNATGSSISTAEQTVTIAKNARNLVLEEAVRRTFQEIDVDHNGVISQAEFKAAVSKKGKSGRQRMKATQIRQDLRIAGKSWKEAYAAFDQDNTRCVTFDSLLCYVTREEDILHAHSVVVI